MYAKLQVCLAALALLLVLQPASGQNDEDFLNARDRVEWEAGGLYDGRFADGTPFQIQLAYPSPASVGKKAESLWNWYWYPRQFTGERIVLLARDAPSGSLKLEHVEPINVLLETLTITLAPDRKSGTGNWISAKSGQRRSFVLRRNMLYKEVAVVRPVPEGRPGGPGTFVYSAIFPVLGDADPNTWMRKTFGNCTSTAECMNSVLVDWSSPSLLTLAATHYEYDAGGAHGESHSSVQHYLRLDAKLVPAGLDHFLDPSPACRGKASAAIVARLRAQQMTWAERGALDKQPAPKFLALPDGLEFHFDPYEVGSYAQGAPSVFLPRAELGDCVKNLPAAE